MRRFDWKWWGMAGVVFALFWAVGYFRLDPDFGWHYGMGRYMVAQGEVPARDPFSYTMPGFEFVDHEWLTNLLMYLGYERWGMGGLAAGFALMATGTWMLVVGGKWRRWAAVPGMLIIAMWLPRGGVRPQVIDWLLVAGLVRWFGDRERWRKWRWLVPVYMGVWANLHGGFAIGTAILVFLLAARMAEERRVETGDAAVGLLAVGATLINPYGARLWYEVWLQLTDTHLRWNIAEWLPFFFVVEFGFLAAATLACALGWRYRHKIEKWRLGMLAATLVAGMGSLRHIGIFAVAAGGVIARGWAGLEEGLPEGPVYRQRWRRINQLFVMLAAVVVGWEVVWEGVSLKYGGRVFPEAAAEWIAQNGVEGRLFSEYGWGGYLIWKLPGEKVFIDGRMPSWRSTDQVPLGETLAGPAVAAGGDSRWAFKEYLRVVDGEDDWEEILDKYGVGMVLWTRGEPNRYRQAVNNWLKRWGWELREKEKKDEKKPLPERLAETGWKKVYEDEVAEIFVQSPAEYEEEN